MAAKTIWVYPNYCSESHQVMRESDPGTDTTDTTTGWQPDTTAAGNYSSAMVKTVQAAGTFSGTAQPDGSIVTTKLQGDCWRSAVPYTGTFDAGDWVIHGVWQRTGTASAAAAGRNGFRIFRSSDTDFNGASATEITASAQLGAIIAPGTPNTGDSSCTITLGSQTFDHEYIFIQLAWEITTAATGHGSPTCGWLLRCGTNSSRVVTPNFTQDSGQTPCVEGGSPTSVTPGDIAWNAPGQGGAADGTDAAYNSTASTIDETSEYLKLLNFGFSVPAGASIDGIVCEVDWLSDTASAIIDYSIRLIVGGSASGTDQAGAAYLSTTTVIQQYGTPTDDWGHSGTLTPADVNGSTFGFQIKVQNKVGSSEVCFVDQMRCTVYYTPAAGANAVQDPIHAFGVIVFKR